MDSQTIPLQDYLEVRPEKREQVVQYIKEGRLLVGPWFVGAGETMRQTFKAPGEFIGECTVHPSGQIVVTISA